MLDLQEGQVYFGSQFKRGQSMVGPTCCFGTVVSSVWGRTAVAHVMVARKERQGQGST